MRLPAREGAPVTFTITDGANWNPFARSNLTVNSASGDVVQWQPYNGNSRGQKVRGWLRFAHTGELGGLPGQLSPALVLSAASSSSIRVCRWRFAGCGTGSSGPVSLLPHLISLVGLNSIAAFEPTRARSSRVASATMIVSHAADRLAKAMVMGTTSTSDPRTLAVWGQTAGVSRGALRVWCAAARMPARSCLDFVRVLRAVMLAKTQPWDLFSTLDVVDRRSLVRLLDRGGVRELAHTTTPPTVDEFLRSQRFLNNPGVIEEVSRRLSEVTGLRVLRGVDYTGAQDFERGGVMLAPVVGVPIPVISSSWATTAAKSTASGSKTLQSSNAGSTPRATFASGALPRRPRGLSDRAAFFARSPFGRISRTSCGIRTSCSAFAVAAAFPRAVLLRFALGWQPVRLARRHAAAGWRLRSPRRRSRPQLSDAPQPSLLRPPLAPRVVLLRFAL